MSGTERVKPWLALSLKGRISARFDTETEANDYARERAAHNLSTSPWPAWFAASTRTAPSVSVRK